MTLSCFVASAAILLATSTSIAANRPAPSARSVGLAELKPNKIEAYKWFAIVGAAVDPVTDEDVKEVSESMTQAQIAEAQHEVDEWIAYHPPPTKMTIDSSHAWFL